MTVLDDRPGQSRILSLLFKTLAEACLRWPNREVRHGQQGAILHHSAEVS